jgi:hypothetical protein
LSLAEHLAGFTLLLAFVLPSLATELALGSGAHGNSRTAASVLAVIGTMAMLAILVVLAPVAGLRRKDLWQGLVPGYGEYYLVVTTWRCGAAILRLAQQRERQRHDAVVPVEPQPDNTVASCNGSRQIGSYREG